MTTEIDRGRPRPGAIPPHSRGFLLIGLMHLTMNPTQAEILTTLI